jgi:hypothetical protein
MPEILTSTDQSLLDLKARFWEDIKTLNQESCKFLLGSDARKRILLMDHPAGGDHIPHFTLIF